MIRMIRTAVIAASLAITFTASQAAQPLTVKVYNAGPQSFIGPALVNLNQAA